MDFRCYDLFMSLFDIACSILELKNAGEARDVAKITRGRVETY